MTQRKKEVGDNSPNSGVFSMAVNHDFGPVPFFATLRNERLQRLDLALPKWLLNHSANEKNKPLPRTAYLIK